ncbi:MAG: hypothetical protein M1142_02600 [Patescibacteria group bacterium]|nr:hypothetical protein [Patescibacteria group bacterium]
MSKLIVLTGKTASGKDTIMAKLLARFPQFKRVVTTTSRTLRNGEANGVDYNFISKADFKQKAEKGDFIEWVEYGGNLYGTEKAQITDSLDQDLIWRIDPSRAGQIRQFIKNSFPPELAEDLLKRTLVIYLTVDDNVILDRLNKRGLTEEEIRKRMQEDREFWQEYQNCYDFVIENVPGRLDETVDQIAEVIQNHHSKASCHSRLDLEST